MLREAIKQSARMTDTVLSSITDEDRWRSHGNNFLHESSVSGLLSYFALLLVPKPEKQIIKVALTLLLWVLRLASFPSDRIAGARRCDRIGHVRRIATWRAVYSVWIDEIPFVVG